MRLNQARAENLKIRQLALRKHGNASRYKRGCRCATCSQANVLACRKYSDTLRMLRAFRAIKKKVA